MLIVGVHSRLGMSWLVLRFLDGGFPSYRRLRESALMDSRIRVAIDYTVINIVIVINRDTQSGLIISREVSDGAEWMIQWRWKRDAVQGLASHAF